MRGGSTALHWAAGKGHREVSLLLEKRANKDAAITGGLFKVYTTLHKAAEEGHREVVSLLLEKQANMDVAEGDGV